MVQGHLSFVFRLVADEAEFPEFAILGELQAAIGQRAKGCKQLPKAIFLHLGNDEQEKRSATRYNNRDALRTRPNKHTKNRILKKHITLYRGRAGKKHTSTTKALHLPMNSLHPYICASKSSPLKRCTQVGGCPQSSTHCNHRQLPTPPHEAPGPQHPNHQGSCPQHSLTFSSQAEDSLCQDTESENH